MSAPDVTPDVSVVVPLYNGARFIDETLTSIERQTLGDIEVIVVDDGSSDDGADRAERHPVGARVLRQQNLGVAVARNRGLSEAAGRWVTFLDQDDLWHPDHVRRALAWFDAHPDEQILFVSELTFAADDDAARLREMDALAAGWAQYVVPEDGALDALIAQADCGGTSEVVHHDLHAMLRGTISKTTSFFAEPRLLRLAGGFAPHAVAMDDYWLLVNVARLHPIPQIDQPTVFYRVHSRATSRSTRLGLPFLSSAIALRLGGGLIPQSEGVEGGLTGGLHGHLLTELLRAPSYRSRRQRVVVSSLARVLFPPDGRRRSRMRAVAAVYAPWLRRLRRPWGRRASP